MKKWTVVVGVVGLAAAAWIVRAVVREEPLLVRTARVERADVEATVTNSKAGTVLARRRAHLSPEVGGRVAEILHREGSHVESGALVLRLDSTEQHARVTLAEREWELAKAQLRQQQIAEEHALRELERQRQLADEAIVSPDELDQWETAWQEQDAAVDAAAAQVAKALASVEWERVQLEKTNLRSPFAGVVAELEVELGEWITPSPPLIPAPAAVDVLDPESTYVRAPIDEVDSARIEVGQIVRVTVDSHPGKVFAGRVGRIAPYVLDVEQQNRTVDVEVEWDDPTAARGVRPGTSADVEIVLARIEGALRIPASALRSTNRVWTVEDGQLKERTVTAGIRNWDAVQIVDGLAEGEVVVATARSEDLVQGRAAEARDNGSSR